MYFRVLLLKTWSNQSATTHHRTLPDLVGENLQYTCLKDQPQVWERDYQGICISLFHKLREFPFMCNCAVDEILLHMHWNLNGCLHLVFPFRSDAPSFTDSCYSDFTIAVVRWQCLVNLPACRVGHTLPRPVLPCPSCKWKAILLSSLNSL